MIYLDKINSPQDVKNLSVNSLKFLSSEIREFLIQSVSTTGGHLASNLGVVELTLALHYCFDSPTDKIIWDVGHQSYVHKMITGRLDDFKKLRMLDGLSGFPKSSESPHDAFNTGHSSTSISAALGYCAARDLKGEDYHVIAVMGDGSLSGGLAFEALNNAGHSNTNIIVILNDNQMSISENVGSLSKYLNEIRTTKSYVNAKSRIRSSLYKVPGIGNGMANIFDKAKDSIRYFLMNGKFFESMGFNYIGPIDGHNIADLINVLEKVRLLSGPILLHVYTTKGKGYTNAENHPSKYHGVESFNVETGEPIKTKVWDTYSDVFGSTITKIAENNPKVVAVTAAMPLGTGLENFQMRFPDRTYDVGIAEEHAVTFSAGLSKGGMIPVFVVYSTFLQRSFDQILHDVCLQNLHVVLAIDHAGIVGADGETHQGIYDISFLSLMPNLTIMSPKNKFELQSMLLYAVKFSGPIALRYPRGAATRILKDFNSPIILGKSETIFTGEEIAIVCIGTIIETAMAVYEKLKKDGFNPTLINARFIKPIDETMVEDLINYKYVFTIEDNVLTGGFGSTVSTMLALKNFKNHIKCFGLPDKLIEQGSPDEIYKRYKLDYDSIYESIKERITTWQQKD